MENFFRLSWTTKVSSRVCGIITKQVLSAHPTTSNHGISSPTFHLSEHDRQATPQSSSVAITSSWSPSVTKIKEVPTTHPTVSELSGNHSCSHLRGGQKGRHAMPRYLLLPPSPNTRLAAESALVQKWQKMRALSTSALLRSWA